jgi:hypothetical protein
MCERCEVWVSRISGELVALPDTWASTGDGQLCLSCRRERAAEDALEATPGDATRDDRIRVRRVARIEFELRRTPDHADNAIAKTCRTSVPAVTAVRNRLRLPSPPPPSSRRRATDLGPASR